MYWKCTKHDTIIEGEPLWVSEKVNGVTCWELDQSEMYCPGAAKLQDDLLRNNPEGNSLVFLAKEQLEEYDAIVDSCTWYEYNNDGTPTHPIEEPMSDQDMTDLLVAKYSATVIVRVAYEFQCSQDFVRRVLSDGTGHYERAAVYKRYYELLSLVVETERKYLTKEDN